MIIADGCWNPAADDRASGRAHRIGQLARSPACRLVTQGSIEDRKCACTAEARSGREGILSGQNGGAVMDAGTLRALLLGQGDTT